MKIETVTQQPQICLCLIFSNHTTRTNPCKTPPGPFLNNLLSQLYSLFRRIPSKNNTKNKKSEGRGLRVRLCEVIIDLEPRPRDRFGRCASVAVPGKACTGACYISIHFDSFLRDRQGSADALLVPGGKKFEKLGMAGIEACLYGSRA